MFHVKDGNVQPYKKSEPIPEVNNEPVKVVVADTLQDMVFNSGKNGVYSVAASLLTFSYTLKFASC